MRACLDDLVIALYVTIDDLLGPDHPPSPPWPQAKVVGCRAGLPGGRPGPAQAATWRAPLGGGSAIRPTWPSVPVSAQPATVYNKRLRGARWLEDGLGNQTWPTAPPQVADRLRLLERHPGPLCRQPPDGHALGASAGGLTTAGVPAISRWYWSLKLYVLTTPDGSPVAWCLASPKLGEREVAMALLDDELSNSGPGQVLIVDKGLAICRGRPACGPPWRRCWSAPTAADEPARLSLLRPLAPVDRVGQNRHPQGPAWAGTARRPHPGRGAHPGRPAAGGPGRGGLVQQAARSAEHKRSLVAYDH